MKLRLVIPGPTEWSSTNPSVIMVYALAASSPHLSALPASSARFQTRYTIFNTSRHRPAVPTALPLLSPPLFPVARTALSNSSLSRTNPKFKALKTENESQRRVRYEEFRSRGIDALLFLIVLEKVVNTLSGQFPLLDACREMINRCLRGAR